MSDNFQLLIDTSVFWLPTLTWLVGQLSASRPGRKIEESIKTRLNWLKEPEFEKAFHSAFQTAVERYQRDYGEEITAQAVARVLAHIAEHDIPGLDRKVILEQIFAEKPDQKILAEVVSRHAFSLEGISIAVHEVGLALEAFITNYLQPAFREEPHFTERIGFAQLVGLLKEIREAVSQPVHDLKLLRDEYCAKVAEKYELITIQGISPKVQNRTIGIRMDEVFVHLHADIDDLEVIRSLSLDYAREFVQKDSMSSNAARLREILDSYVGASPNLFAELSELTVQATLFEEFERSISTRQYERRIRRKVSKEVYQNLRASAEARLRYTRVGSVRSQGRFPLELNTLLRFRRCVVRGDPGSGKSTLTRYIAWAVAKREPEHIGVEAKSKLPIRIRAIEFGAALEQGRVDSLEEFLAEDSGRFAPLVKEALAAGKALILLDGLDEVGNPALQGRVKERVDDFLADPAYVDNFIIITTRIVGYERGGLTGEFPHFTLAELNDDQISEFVNKWYVAIHSEMPTTIDVNTEQKQLLEAVIKNESIHRMARNPLLLTIIALIKWQGRALPDQRVLLYDAAAQTLIRTWPLAQRQVLLDELLIREWLAPVALAIFANATTDLIDEYSLMDQLVESMMRLKSMPELEARLASQALLEEVSRESGILLPRGVDEDGRNLYGFLHQTFAEYLAAYFLAGRWEDGELELLAYAHHPYWREVILLMAGHLGIQRRAKAGQFIQSIRNLQSSQYEDVIHRDLLLVGRILGDGVPVGPGNLIESVLKELLQIWVDTPISLLKFDIEKILTNLNGTEYASVVGRLARNLEWPQIKILASLIGPENLQDALAEVLAGKEHDSRCRAAELLVDAARRLLARQDPNGNRLLDLILGDSDPDVRFYAARLLARQKDSRGINALIELIKTENTQSRFWAAQALAELDDARGYQILNQLLTKQESEKSLSLREQVGAARILALHKEPHAMEILVRLLKSNNFSVRYEIATFLLKEDSVSTDTLINIMDTGDPSIARNAFERLLTQGDLQAVSAIVEFIRKMDKSTDFRISVLPNIDLVSALLKYSEPKVRLMAALMLVGQDDILSSITLKELLTSNVDIVSISVAKLLAQQGDSQALDILVELSEHGSPEIRFEAATILKEIGNSKATSAFEDLLDVKDENIRFKAALLLTSQGNAHGIAALRELFSSDDSHIRVEAIKVLCKLGESGTIVTLLELLDDPNYRLRFLAARSLIELHNEKVLVLSQHNIKAMLADTKYARNLPGRIQISRSVADVAYEFVNLQLSPSGQLGLDNQSDLTSVSAR